MHGMAFKLYGLRNKSTRSTHLNNTYPMNKPQCTHQLLIQRYFGTVAWTIKVSVHLEICNRKGCCMGATFTPVLSCRLVKFPANPAKTHKVAHTPHHLLRQPKNHRVYIRTSKAHCHWEYCSKCLVTVMDEASTMVGTIPTLHGIL